MIRYDYDRAFCSQKILIRFDLDPRNERDQGHEDIRAHEPKPEGAGNAPYVIVIFHVLSAASAEGASPMMPPSLTIIEEAGASL